MEISIERTIKGYDLIERIGQGAYGAVYRARQQIVNREVAVKVILPQYANQPDFIRRFETEAQLVAQLEHIHIVPLYDYWRDPEGAYLVMRLMRGGSLADMIRQNDPWQPQVAAQLVDQIASALDTAHRKGIIHRDLKPANILLDEDGNAYLSDFGIAKAIGVQATQTATGAIVGTPAYISPEQAQSQQVSSQTDIYTLGVMLFELLSGEHPFPDTPTGGMILKHINQPLPLLRESHPNIPRDVDNVIQKATSKNPTSRYKDALSLAEDFRRALQLEADLPEIALGEIQNPYKGLRAFQEADTDDFFGREALTGQLLSRLGESEESSRFLVVVGPSGSGKSSVVKAGLLPALRAGGLPDSERWFIVEMMPGPNPMEELELALLSIAVDSGVNLNEQLNRDKRGLLRAVRLALPGKDSELLLVIDQFEELFTLVEDEAQASFFMESLYTAVMEANSHLRVVVTLRADFYDRPLMHPDFGRLVEERTAIVLPLSAEELDRAIRGPAERAGTLLEAGLSPAIIADVIEQPGALPLLQYALTELFERRESRLLTNSAYRSIGGVLGALGRRAEEIYIALDGPGKSAARQLFLRLITLGEGEEDTRRRVLFSEVETLHPISQSQVLEEFGKARLLTFDRDPLTREPTVEVAHEALLQKWGRLRKWLDESRADLRVQRMVGNTAAEWLEAGKDDSYLLRGSRLDQIEAWSGTSEVALTQVEGDFLKASLAERDARRTTEAERQAHEAALERRSRSFLRALTAVLAVAAIAAAVLSGVALNQRGSAISSAATATHSQGQAQIDAATAVAAQNEAQVLAAAEAQARQEAERTGRLSTSNELVAIARAELAAPSDVSRSLALLLAREAVLTTLETDGYVTGGAEATLRQAIDVAPVQRITFAGHSGAVNDASWSPDGSYVATAGDDNTARIWDVGSGIEIHVLSGHSGLITDVDWNPDGSRLLTASHDGSVRIWDTATGLQEDLVLDHDSSVSLASWSEDGERIVTLSRIDISVWDAQTGEELLRRQIHSVGPNIARAETVYFAEMSPDGKWIATRHGNSIVVISAVTGDETLRMGRLEQPISGQWSQDGRRLLIAHDLGTTVVWNAQRGVPLGEFRQAENARIRDVSWNPGEDQVATVTTDGIVTIWDGQSRVTLDQWQLNKVPIHSIEWSPDGRSVLTAGEDGLARIWTVAHSGQRGQFNHRGPANTARWSSDGEKILSAAGVLAHIWEAESGLELGSFGEGIVIYAAAWNPQGDRIATGDATGTVVIWDPQNGEPLLKMPGQGSAINAVAWNSDGSQIITSGRDRTARIWDVKSGEVVNILSGHGGGVFSASWSPDDDLIITTSADGLARIWEAETGVEVMQLQGHSDQINAADWSPDGRLVATASSDRTARIWDHQTGMELRQLRGHSAAVLSVNWDPSGQQLVTGSDDRTAIIWDALTGEQVGRVSGHDGSIWETTWSPDGTQILTASFDHTAQIWPVGIEGLLKQAEALILRDPPEFTLEERCIYLHECGE